ncbi:MAG TPA: AAA family ATPase, partial [Vicinamibacteria bacterium]
MSQEPGRPPGPDSGPFVGRASELAALQAALEQAKAGAGRFVLVAGGAGIGKTSLLSEFLRRAREHQDPPLTLCRGRCTEQYGKGEAYMIFLDGLGGLLVGRGAEPTKKLLRTYAPTWCLQFPAVFDREAQALQRQTVGANQERMLREFGDVIDATSRDFPVLLIGEDLQWADPASVDLLRYLVGRLARARMLMILTLRDASLERANPAMYRGLADLRPHFQEIRLGPLPGEAVASYVDGTFRPNRFPPDFKRLLEQRTEGHPLFLQSLSRFLMDRGDVVWDGKAFALSRPLEGGDVPAPENVRDMIRRSFEALDEGDRATLQNASVLGREFESAVLARVLEVDEADLEDRLLRLARNHRLLSKEGEEELADGTVTVRYRFAHSLYPETLYDDLATSRRQKLHRLAALALVERHADRAWQHAAALALHFEKGRELAASIEWRRKAADHATSRHAYAEALDHLDRGAALLEKVEEPERTRLSLLLLEKRGAVNHTLGRFDLAIRDFSLMRERARASRDALRESDALVGLAGALFFARRPEEMAVRAHEALLAAAHAASPPHLAAARLVVALLLQDMGELESAESVLVPLLEEARRLGLRPVLMGALLQRGTLHYWRSEYAESEALLVEALSLATELGDGFTALVALFFAGNARVNLGRIGEGRRTLEEGLALARRNGESYWLARLLSQVGWLHRELEDFERARQFDREALQVAQSAKVRWAPEPDTLLSLFIDDAGDGAPSPEAATAQAIFDRTSAERAAMGWFFEIRLERAFAELYRVRREPGPLREHAQRLLVAAALRRTPTYGVAAHKLLADAALLEDR